MKNESQDQDLALCGGSDKLNYSPNSVFIRLSEALRNSKCEILRLYSEEMGKIEIPDAGTGKNQPAKPVTPEMSRQIGKDVKVLGKLLKTTPGETLLFTAIYSMQIDQCGTVNTSGIAGFFGVANLYLLPMKSSLHSLIQKGVVRQLNYRRKEEYRVSGTAIHAIEKNQPFKPKKKVRIDRYKFCETISSLIKERSNGEIDTDELFSLVQEKEDQYNYLAFVKKIGKMLPSLEDRTLFYEICHDFVETRSHRSGLESTLTDIYDDNGERLDMAQNLMSQTHTLQVDGLVELLPAESISEAEMALTEKAKRLFLQNNYDLYIAKGGSDKQLLPPEKIPARELFFNRQLESEINMLRESLDEKAFAEVQRRWKTESLSKGLAVLFHGLPGTGKTATAEMLAKATGRGIYHVDIAASKSCWFGESEKLFKKIFTDYRRMCETEKLKPILLFNEADALFSTRHDVTFSNRTQTENALQNILLEEMETLDGILIATTNLCENFDNAFGRRFIYKVHFGQPDTAAKKAIWRSKMKWLSEEECGRLAIRYNLSGGEIDNIVRKCIMEEVRSGEHPSIEMIEAWCGSEKLTREGETSIGFTCSSLRT